VLDIFHQVIAMVLKRMESTCCKDPSLSKSTTELLFKTARSSDQVSRPSKS
jgi:hypothetical protein